MSVDPMNPAPPVTIAFITRTLLALGGEAAGRDPSA
jgi:hypothetical protein